MCRQKEHLENGKSATRSMVLKWRSGKILLKTIWRLSAGFSIHPMGKFASMIDWQVFQIRAALGMKCWLAVMRQSGFSPWSRQRTLWNNLAAGLTEVGESFRGQKVGSFYWYEQQHKWTWELVCCNHTSSLLTTSLCIIRFFSPIKKKQKKDTIDFWMIWFCPRYIAFLTQSLDRLPIVD